MSSGFVISEIDIDRCMNDRHRYNSDSWADVAGCDKSNFKW